MESKRVLSFPSSVSLLSQIQRCGVWDLFVWGWKEDENLEDALYVWLKMRYLESAAPTPRPQRVQAEVKIPPGSSFCPGNDIHERWVPFLLFGKYWKIRSVFMTWDLGGTQNHNCIIQTCTQIPWLLSRVSRNTSYPWLLPWISVPSLLSGEGPGWRPALVHILCCWACLEPHVCSHFIFCALTQVSKSLNPHLEKQEPIVSSPR